MNNIYAPSTSMTAEELKAIVLARIQKSSYGVGKDDYDYQLGLYDGSIYPKPCDGLSSYVSKDYKDTVRWMMPSVIEVLGSTDELVRFDARKEEDEDDARQATDICNYILFQKNNGVRVLHDAIKDSLILRAGFVKVTAEQEEPKLETYQGLDQIQLQELATNQGTLEIEVYDQYQVDIGGQVVVLSDVRVQVISGYRYVVEAIKPELMRIDAQAKDLESARFIAHQFEMTLSDLREQFPDERIEDDDMEILSGSLSDSGGTEAKLRERINDGDLGIDDGATDGDKSMRTVNITDAYLKVDYDQDGIAEWRNVLLAGDRILINEPCTDHPFAEFVPMPEPHQLKGECFGDLTSDVQSFKTNAMRTLQDGMALGVYGRTGALNDGSVDMESLANIAPGGIVLMSRPEAIFQIPPPSVDYQMLFKSLEYMDMVKAENTGISKFNQGLDANALNHTATGVNQIMDASGQIKQFILRMLSMGVKNLFRKILQCASQHQSIAMTVKLRGKWVSVDPRIWKNEYDISANIGINAGSKNEKVQALMMIKQLQQEAIMAAMQNQQIPKMANFNQMYNTLNKLVEAIGFPSAEAFFIDPTQEMQQKAQQPPPDQSQQDPKMQMEQMKLQAQSVEKEKDRLNKLQISREQNQVEIQKSQYENQSEITRNEQRLAYSQLSNGINRGF